MGLPDSRKQLILEALHQSYEGTTMVELLRGELLEAITIILSESGEESLHFQYRPVRHEDAGQLYIWIDTE